MMQAIVEPSLLSIVTGTAVRTICPVPEQGSD